MTIHNKQIFIGVVIEVEEASAPTAEWTTDRAETKLIGAIIKTSTVEIEMQRVGIAGKIRGEDIRSTVAIDITDRNPHRRLLATRAVNGDSTAQTVVDVGPRFQR